MFDLENNPALANWRFPGCPATPDCALDFDSLIRQFEWLRRMDGCPQDPHWHAEGDVLIHVSMVTKQLVASPGWRQLEPLARNIVFAGALLHDVAKPMVTAVEEGRIRSRGHAVLGTRVARRILMEHPAFGPAGVPFAVRENIVALVRHHGLPATLIDKPDPQRSLITASMTARCDWLAVLADADSRGRICTEPDDSVTRLEMFRAYCAENNCVSGPYPFTSASSQFRYFKVPGSPATIDIFDPSTFEVTLMSGLPAAGKDTWISRNFDGPIVSLDELREQMDVDPGGDQGTVITAAKEQAKAYLRQRQPFVWNATNTGRSLREGLVNLFASYGARVRIVYCEASLRTMQERNRRRSVPVPQRVMDKLLDHLDMPDLTEAFSVDYAV